MRTLLLADDSITVQRVIGLTFAAEDFEIVTVSDGQAAIDRIKAQPPDIVLAGSAMPNVSGYDVASFVRSQPALSHLPVLLLTGAFESVDAERLSSSGASGVIEKPLDPTAVISRVKELLGIKGDAHPAPAPGRPVTPAATPADRKKPAPREAPASSKARRSEPPPVRVSKADSRDERRDSSGPAPDAGSVDGGNGSGSDDYLDTLDAAFDSLDQKLAGREDQPRYAGRERRVSPERTKRDGRNPAPPLAHDGTVVDPRSPSRRPAPPPPKDTASSAVFEMDDAWFADDGRAQGDGLAEQKELAAEMGIHDIETPQESGAADAAAPDAAAPDDAALDAAALDAAAPDAAAPTAVAPNTDLDSEFGPHGEPTPTPAPAPEPTPPPTAAPTWDVADDFAALLAYEQGEQPHPPAPSAPAAAPVIVPAAAPVIVPAAAPEITDAMLDRIAERVAERLNAGSLGEHLRDAITATIRDTVHAVVSDTSERLVRDEIARIKAQAERETH